MLNAADELHSNETCQRILEAAAEEFARNGFASARVRHIVEAAQVNLAAINYYFGGKEGLYKATLSHLAARLPYLKTSARKAVEPPQKRLERHVLLLLQRYVGGKHPSTLGRILAHEAMKPSPHASSLVQEVLRPDLEAIRALVREIAGDGASNEDVTHMALGMVGQCLLYLLARPVVEQLLPQVSHGEGALRELAQRISQLSIGGMNWMRATAPLVARPPVVAEVSA